MAAHGDASDAQALEAQLKCDSLLDAKSHDLRPEPSGP